MDLDLERLNRIAMIDAIKASESAVARKVGAPTKASAGCGAGLIEPGASGRGPSETKKAVSKIEGFIASRVM
ncbi:MAG: hypothetical protein QXQ76_06210, partial [Candidatus Bathyarchaeia archaeon]